MTGHRCGLEDDEVPAGFVQLRVGGKRFETSVDVLLSDEESVFNAMLRGAWAQYGAGAKPMVFDRDPKRFRVVLNWLRTRELVCEDGVTAEGIRAEAEFFQMPTLAKEAMRLIQVSSISNPWQTVVDA